MAYRFFFAESCLQIWAEARKSLETNPNQPRKQDQENVAGLAKFQRLIPFADLSIVGDYGERYGQEPDSEVFPFVSFGTVMNFAIMWKERSEYSERFNYIWSEIQKK